MAEEFDPKGADWVSFEELGIVRYEQQMNREPGSALRHRLRPVDGGDPGPWVEGAAPRD